MKRFLMLMTIALTCFSLAAPVAEARRMGGGSSFGKSRSMPQRQAPAREAQAPSKQNQADNAAKPASGISRFMGPLAGLAIGAGLATMLSGGGLGGFGSGMGSLLMMLLLAGGVLFLFKQYKKSQLNNQQGQANLQYAGGSSSYNNSQSQLRPNNSGSSFAGSTNTQANAQNIPADFPQESFLRNAKASFIRLQAANDVKDLNDIRQYTTPEVFAEISLQLQERGNAPQQTNVIAIEAELLEVVTEGDYTIASVRFTGQLSENNSAVDNVDEIWHIQKNAQETNAEEPNANWLLAGIQQPN